MVLHRFCLRGAPEASSRSESTIGAGLRLIMKVLEVFSLLVSSFVIPLRYISIYSMG